jgi:hypothetical protein
MTKRTLFIALAVFLVLVASVLSLTVFAPRFNDRELVLRSLQESIDATKKGRPGGVLDNLSLELKVNESDVGSYRRDIAKWIRDQRPDIEVKSDVVTVNEQEGIATMTAPVTVSLSLLGNQQSFDLKDVRLVFRKEDARNYLIFPTRKWRLYQVSVPNEGIPPELTGL